MKVIIAFLCMPFLPLHLMFYFVFRKRCIDDVRVNLKQSNIRINSIVGFVYLIIYNRTFRNLFLWRIGVCKYLLVNLYPSPHPSFTIATHMKLGPGMTCIHPFATIVNAESIGKGFVVLNNVTVGNNKSGERPIIGDNVRINANAVVIGKIVIGNNAIIGAGSVVTKSIPDNCVVVGNPAFILKENGVIVKRPL